MKNEPIVVEHTLNASSEKIWKAITSKTEMKKWYFDVSDFRPEIGFEFRFDAGPDDMKYVHHCKVVSVTPQRKLSYTWRYDGYAGDSKVTFDLTPLGEGENAATTIRVTHEGVETFPPQPDFTRKSFEDGWKEIIGKSLRQFVECP